MLNGPMRRVCRLVIMLFMVTAWWPSAWSAPQEPVRIGLTPVFLDDQTSSIESWRTYLERQLGRPVVFSQRSNYRDIIDLLLQGKLDFAWVCGYPYVRYETELRITAVPLYQGKPLYRAYLIVPSDDKATQSLTDLRGKVFAYSDADSNSGYLVVQYQLLNLGTRSSDFFRRTFYTGAHRKVVEAVANGVADGGTVDGYVWDVLSQVNPELTSRTRVVSRSEAFGFPPLVARRTLDKKTIKSVQNAMLHMNKDVEGEALLRRLRLDGFTAGNPELFNNIRRMMVAVRGPRSAAQP